MQTRLYCNTTMYVTEVGALIKINYLNVMTIFFIVTIFFHFLKILILPMVNYNHCMAMAVIQLDTMK